ncbi:hypothetical protein GCM10010532_097590 [Dactylosporangium siamense]
MGPAQFFSDACALLVEHPPMPSVTHVVAHLFREIESAVRAVLEGPGAGVGATGSRHRAKILAVLDDLGIEATSSAALFWLGFAGEDSPSNLAGRAHRSALDPPRALDEDFLEIVQQFELVLDVVLDRFEVNFVTVFAQIDELLEIEAPTRANAKTLRQNRPSVYAVAHEFFSRASAAWVGPLTTEGFFLSPPPVVEEDGQISYEPWPAGDYLARIAGDGVADVVDVALAIPPTDNPFVNRNVVQVALRVSPDAARRLVLSIVRGLGSRYGVRIPYEVGQVVERLALGNITSEALHLARALLSGLAQSARARDLAMYDFGRILRDHVPALARAAGRPALVLLCDLFDLLQEGDGARYRRPEGDDGSLVWRSRLDDDGGRGETDIEHAIVNAVRDTAITIAEQGDEAASAVITELERRPWLIMRRLALHTLSSLQATGSELAAARLCDRTLAADLRVEPEYVALLARRGAISIGAEHLQAFLAVVEDASSLLGSDDQDAIDDWTIRRLHPMQAVLPSDWAARLRALATKFQLADGTALAELDRVPARPSWEVASGPVAQSDLAAMPTAELVEFLRNWEPDPTDWRPLGPTALNGELSAAIERDAARRSADAATFIGLPAVYVGAVVSGLWQAVQAGREMHWSGLVDLATWISQEAERELGTVDANREREWRRPRCDLMRLLRAALNRPTSDLPAEHESMIWSILESACADPDPAPTREEATASGNGFGSPRSLSLAENAVRPLAIRAAIGFGMRLRRRDPDANLDAVLNLLDHHINMWAEPALAVRSVFGERFAALLWMAPAWTRANATKIFPADDTGRLLLDASWEGFLASGQVPATAPVLLPDVYQTMVRRPAKSNHDRDWDPYFLLGCHLVLFLREGTLSLDGQDQLLRTFYSQASADTADRIMFTTSTTLDRPEIPETEIQALTAWWDFRVAKLKGTGTAGELAHFGRWFASEKFDVKWSFAQLVIALQRAGTVDSESAVLERLAGLADSHPSDCLSVLEELITPNTEGWRLSASQKHLETVLRHGTAGDEVDYKRSQRLISRLALHHGVRLRHLLRP